LLAVRKSITSGVIEARVKGRQWRRHKEEPTEYTISTLWFQGSTRRQSDVFADKHWKPTGVRDDKCIGCMGASGLEFRDRPPGEPVTPVVFNPMSTSGGVEIMEPRIIGLVPDPWSILYAAKFDMLITNRDRTDLSIRPADAAGRRLREIRFRWKEADCRYVVDLDQGPSIVEWEYTKRPPDALHARMYVTNRLVEGTGIWFPARTELERTVGGEPEYQETIEFTRVSLNQPIDAKVFELAGMGLKPPRVILGYKGRGSSHVWDGERAVPRQEYDRAQALLRENPPPKPGAARVAGIALAVAALFCLLAYAARAIYVRRGREAGG
jgi:hypothetical protein